MYKKILCAIDINSESETVIKRARALADQNNSNLSIVHVIEYTFLPKDYQQKLKEDVLPKMQYMAEKYNVKKKDSFVKFGQSYSQICDLEDKHDIDLVVIGSHGKHGIKALLGSTANAVLQQVKCDVLLVKLNETS